MRKRIFPGRSVWGAHIVRTTHASWWSNCRVFQNNQPFPRWCYTAARFPCQPCPLRNHPLNESLRFVEFNNETSCASASAAGAGGDSEWALRHGWCTSQRRRWVTGPKKREKEKEDLVPCVFWVWGMGWYALHMCVWVLPACIININALYFIFEVSREEEMVSHRIKYKQKIYIYIVNP